MIKYNGFKFTPNELAKLAVEDKGDCADYFLEGYTELENAMTEKELEAFFKAVEKQKMRVRNFLNTNELSNKFYK